MSFSILHRRAESGGPLAPGAADRQPVWSTCLREIVFHEAPVADTGDGNGQALADADAYAFLLETICGLHSPMIGETQVLGQFRAFLGSLSPADASWLGAIGRQLTSDARTIRERHLRGLGSRSYGSAVRRYLDGIEVVGLIGAGALACELFPYLSDGRTVDQWTRAQLAAPEGVPVRDAAAAVVVAAPVDAQAIAAAAGRYRRLVRVIDLRGADGRDDPRAAGPGHAISRADVVTLDDLFAHVAASSHASAARLAEAKREIREMAAAFQYRQLLRPLGWDDLCA